jgi:hypothetical protein
VDDLLPFPKQKLYQVIPFIYDFSDVGVKLNLGWSRREGGYQRWEVVAELSWVQVGVLSSRQLVDYCWWWRRRSLVEVRVRGGLGDSRW